MLKTVLSAMILILGVGGAALASGGGGVHWGYSGDTGPAHWGRLSPDFRMCGEGNKQSPINITGAVEGELPELQLSYDPSDLDLLNNGHTIKLDYTPGSSLTVGGETYRLLQFHFHSLSENAIDGRLFPLEAHLVHADAAGNLAVLSVLFEEGPANPLLAKLWKYLPAKASSTMEVNDSINVGGLLPDNLAYYSFTGSLTTPPCTEGVRWMVLKQPVNVSAEQVEKFRRVFHEHDTNRPVQLLNGRVIYE